MIRRAAGATPPASPNDGTLVTDTTATSLSDSGLTGATQYSYALFTHDRVEELINGRTRTYAHIVLDEAQDLSPMQLRSIRRRSRTGSMTVVGDVAQSTGAWARDSWDEVAEDLVRDVGVQSTELTLGYRVPRQVFEFAAQLLPFAAPEVTAPRVVRDGPAEPELIETQRGDFAKNAVAAASTHAGNGRFVGLICPCRRR